MGNIFFEITIILCLAAFLSLIFRFFKQPLILAYILTGIIIGPFGQLQLGNKGLIETMGELGITLLLFMLGLELKLSELRSIGKIAATIGITQIIVTFFFGYFISIVLGFSSVVSLYIAIALTFSSTIMVVKLLSDKKDLASLHGKISIGVLLIQDLFAIFVLILLPEFNLAGNSSFSYYNLFLALIKGVVMFAFVIFLGKSVFPKLIKSVAKSSETLFLLSIAWVFGLTALISSPVIGFPMEIGGLLAGLALANSIANYQIIARVRSLRDFFIIIFFVILGLGMSFENLDKVLLAALGFSVFVLLGKPLILMSIMGIMGYRKRTSFLTAAFLSQISEFSLIVVFLGTRLGRIPNDVSSTIIIVGIISFVVSNYMIFHANSLYNFFNPYLKIFEKKTGYKDNMDGVGELKNHVVLIGAHRVGKSILDALKEEGEDVCVIDFNPDIVSKIKDETPAFFGDISDVDILERVGIDKAKLVISTVPDLDDNLLLIRGLNQANRLAKIIVLAQDADDARALYKAGADYVVLPQLAGGRQVVKILKEGNLSSIHLLKLKDLNYLD
ncbi:MAG: cation:proton antiporter [Candidatus Levybacteria bacterium]|nr:cation:proton antiporter [Candidatus Levybacteria bacterium]